MLGKRASGRLASVTAAALMMSASLAASALAQSPAAGNRGSASNGGPGVRAGNITSTGATVPNPGASQSGGTTSMDRGIQAEDNKIQGSICKGC